MFHLDKAIFGKLYSVKAQNIAYYDDTGKGKFLRYCEDKEIDQVDIV